MKAFTHSRSTAAIRAQQAKEILKMEQKNPKKDLESVSLFAKKPEQDQLRSINMK